MEQQQASGVNNNKVVINIFGVGRSGTKSIQVYLAYILAKQNTEVWINYEPYFWLNRKLGYRSKKGIYFDTKEDFFTNSLSSLSSKHIKYLSGLAEGNSCIVNKFIRGHGRINEINKIIKPNHTIIVVREVFGVLNSLKKTGFDLFSTGKFSQVNYFKKQVSDFRKTSLYNIEHEKLIREANNELRKNALIWYFYNLTLLDYKNAFFVDFENLKAIENYAHKELNTNIKFEKNSTFNGHNIHTDDLFNDVEICRKKETIFSKIILYTFGRIMPITSLAKEFIGSAVNINGKFNYNNKPHENHSNNKYEKIEDEFIHNINDDLMKRLKQKTINQII